MKFYIFLGFLSFACFISKAQEANLEGFILGEWFEEANFLDQNQELGEVLNEYALLEDVILNDSLFYGVDYLYGWGVEEGYLEAGEEYFFDRVNVIQPIQGNSTLAYFDVTLGDGKTDSSFWVAVYYNSTDQNKSIEDVYAIVPILATPDNGKFMYQNWTHSYSWKEFKNNIDNAKDVFFAGVNDLLAEAVAQGVLENEHYYATVLYFAGVSKGANEDYYIFNAVLNTENLGKVEVIFTVKVQGDTKTLDRYILFPVL